MTISVEVETRIGRAQADVFAGLTAIEQFPDWLIASGIVRVERLDGGPLAVGSGVRIAQTVGGRSTVFDGAVSALDPGRSLGLRGRDKDGVSIEIEATLAPDGDHAMHLGWALRIGLPLRFRMFESMVAPQVRRAAALDLEAFKRRLESGAGA